MATWLNTALDLLNRANVYLDASSPSGEKHPEVKIDTMPKPTSANNFMTLDKLNSVEFDSTHLWALRIAGAPSPFNDWFPAQMVEEQSKGASVSSISFGIDEINMLNSYNALSFRVEMLDDANSTLEKWLRAWQKSISIDPITKKPYLGFRYIEDILTTMTIIKYNWQKEQVSRTDYYVIPVGNISLNRQNDPSLKVLNVNFASFGSAEL